MKSKAAVLWGVGEPWKIEEIDVDEPKQNELVVQWRAAGLCHSDEHLVTGDLMPPPEQMEQWGISEDDFYPLIGGHEGSGVVVSVGPGVTSVEVGDHVAASFVPSCGHCESCSNGHQNLCDNGAGTLSGGMITDGTHRHHLDGKPMPLLAKLGTFSEYTCVSEMSVIKVEKDLPFECVALVSCGVATGWGSAVRRAEVRPGDIVVVVGIGGIGINAVQGARSAGAKWVIAVDPIALKREKAMEFGATHTFPSMDDAIPAIQEMSWGKMADKVIMTPGVMHGHLMAGAMALCRKNGTVVVTGGAPIADTEASVSLFDLTMMNKEIKGSIFGSLNPRADIPKLLGLYREGDLKIDELISKRYQLEEINEGYRAMRDGENLRGVIVYS